MTLRSDDHDTHGQMHGPRVPRISTRHCYDLETGRPLHPKAAYRLYPQRYFADVVRGSRELVIVVHGLRNDSKGALEKVIIAKNMISRLRPGSSVPPVVGFSYDSNTLGAHLARYQLRALGAGRRIARANGRHLARFITDFKKDAANGRTLIRLLGHSLGSEVTYHCMMHLAYGSTGGLDAAATCAATAPAGIRTVRPRGRDMIESVHLFGSSLPADIQDAASVRRAIDHVVRGRLVNCYAPTDAVLLEASSEDVFGDAAAPLGLRGALSAGARGKGKKPARAGKYSQRLLYPADHRFASYADAMRVPL